MAFNFRPKNVAEILKKKKKSSQPASLVYQYIMETYGDTIILDPTKDFNDIKVPRTIEKETDIATLKRKMSKKIDIKGLTIKFGNGSGAKGNSSAIETAMQENATLFCCEQVIEKKGMPTGDKIAEIYPDYDDSWHNTFKMSSSALKQWLKSERGYEYSRDKGFMPFLEKLVMGKMGVSTIDNWNPADIYLVKRNKRRSIENSLTAIGNLKLSPAEKLDMCNAQMRDLFKSRELIGVSLKKLGKRVSVEESNVSKITTKSDISIVRNSIKCNLDLQSNGVFETGELSFKINVDNKDINVQIRAFSGGERESTQMDMTAVGASAKLGKVSSANAIDPFIRKYNLKRRMGTHIPKVGQFTQTDIADYVKEQKKLAQLTIDGNKVDFGTQSWEETLLKATLLEVEDPKTASQLSAKLQCFQWITILNTIDKKNKLQDFLTILYHGAKKEYETAGPFLKIS